MSAGDGASDAYPGMPRWVKITLIVVAVGVLVALAAALLLGGSHGPGRHVPT